MTGISGTSAIGGGGAFSALISQAMSGAATSGTSGAGPAYLLGGGLGGGSPVDAALGLYNSLGQTMAAFNPQGTSQAQATAAADERHNAALANVAGLLRVGDIQGGRSAAMAMVRKNSQDASALALIGRSHAMEQDYAEAERYYGRASALAPSQARIRSDLENVRTLQQSDDEVLAVARRKLKIGGSSEDALRLLFELTDRSPQNAEAHVALSDAFAVHGQALESLLSLQTANIFAAGATVGEVIQRAEKLVERHPDVGMVHNLLGKALGKVGRTREAFQELAIAHSVAPNNVTYGHDLAEAYVKQAEDKLSGGDLTGAGADLSKAYEISAWTDGYRETTARLEAERGKRDLDAGRYTMGIQHLNSAKSHAPADESFRSRLSLQYLRVARYMHGRGENNSALNMYKAANELDPTSYTARYNTAVLSHAEGLERRDELDYEQAIEHLERAYQLESHNDQYRQDLAGVYDLNGVYLQALGKLDEAIESFDKGRLLDPANEDVGAHYLAAVAERDGS
ncbi:MAG: hypothetical protein GY842_00375 [bacterium]|nr:hypothetical protein [bacterium]